VRGGQLHLDHIGAQLRRNLGSVSCHVIGGLAFLA
jgi:hypothetical protein